MKNPPSQQLLQELFNYSPVTGIFTRRKARSNRVKVGEVAGCYSDSSGYVQISVNKKVYRAHQLAWIYVHGTPPIGYLDHINGDKHDNRIANLRLATAQQNAANSRRPSHNRSSGVKGVTWFRPVKKWMAHITIDQRQIYLGYFTDKEDAIKARLDAAERYFGEFAKH